MKKRRNPFSRIRIVFTRGNPTVKIVLLLVVVLSIGALITIHCAITKAEAESERARQAAIAEELEKQKYQNGIDKAGTDEGNQDYAENELDMIPGDNQIFEGETTP